MLSVHLPSLNYLFSMGDPNEVVICKGGLTELKCKYFRASKSSDHSVHVLVNRLDIIPRYLMAVNNFSATFLRIKCVL